MELIHSDPDNGTIFRLLAYRYSSKILVGTASCLSILGASLIIFTYLAYPELRTTLRQILLNLSIADFISATANLVGMSINFYHYLDPRKTPYQNQSEVWQKLCLVQGGFAVFGTDSSILWTMSMALYMFVVVVLKRPEFGERLYLIGHYVFCWGLPAIITVVFGSVGWLGFEPYTTPGWCDIRTTQRPSTPTSNETYTVAPVAIRYSLFLYTSFILLPPMFVAIRCSLSRMVKTHNYNIIALLITHTVVAVSKKQDNFCGV